MSNRLGDVQNRLGTVRELESVVSAMRGIAATRTREALSRLPGIRACADLIGLAIADAMSIAVLQPPERPGLPLPDDTHVYIVIGPEHGFVGTYNQRVLQAIHRPGTGSVEYFIVGDRARSAADELGLPMTWSSEMIVHADAASDLAEKIVNALYGRLRHGNASHVTLVHGVPQAISEAVVQTTSLLPFDFRRFKQVTPPFPPVVTLPIQQLQERLAEEYVYTQVCEAIILSFAAENEARMRAMIAAKRNIDDTAQRLSRDYHRLRQEQITAEIVELSTVDGGVAS
ncbi:F0F1 ATP synthase subunit gamma [Burkholderia sp. AU30280]|uniref:F0F1 ATP synthase subunit gamma n=1 Tax=Burkholderia sp. AU30280 TaxID=2879628 RepID=UPI001CF1BE7A|nr:FoF1 ATP synthase subunit gamma [Burkholderia sp. AU30280]MCA8276527.1 F0F1 ATP synthase subunit gamma [Burkholderia sp. AU30280]